MPHPATSPPNTCGASAVSSWKKTRRAGQREFVLLKVIVLWPTKINNRRKKLSTENPTVKGGRHEDWWNPTPRAASSCSHLFVPVLVGLLFFQNPEPQQRMWLLILGSHPSIPFWCTNVDSGMEVQVSKTLSKATILCRRKKERGLLLWSDPQK